MGAREYLPEVGRFLSPDPLIFGGGDTNLYVFAGGDPVNQIDPTGNHPLVAKMLVGCITGATWSILWQVVLEGKSLSWSCLDWGDIGMGCLLGALGAPKAPRVLNAGQRARGAARAGARSLCFAEGTSVKTPDGPVPIESLDIGDLVLAQNDETGEQSWRPVTETFKTRRQDVVSLDLAGDDPPILATPGHLFWKDGAGWTGAGELGPGDLVWTTSGWREVESVSDAGAEEFVYNLEVDEDHTYFVGDDGAWVHNACDGRRIRDRLAGRSSKLGRKELPKGTGRSMDDLLNMTETELRQLQASPEGRGNAALSRAINTLVKLANQVSRLTTKGGDL